MFSRFMIKSIIKRKIKSMIKSLYDVSLGVIAKKMETNTISFFIHLFFIESGKRTFPLRLHKGILQFPCFYSVKCRQIKTNPLNVRILLKS